MGGQGDERTRGRWGLFIVHCSLFILALTLLWPVVRHPGWWLWKPGAPHSDLAVTHWPSARFARRALWEEGRFPLWRPTLMSGVPFAANPLAGLYYPLNWVFLFLPWLPLELGFNLSALAHLWLAGAAMYGLMRRGFGAGMWGALVAAVAYEASPRLLAHLGAGHVGWVQAWGWLPVVVLCWLEALRGMGSRGQGVRRQGDKERGRKSAIRNPQSAIYAGAALAVQFCADVRMAVYTLAALVTLTLMFLIRHLSFAIRCLSLAFCLSLVSFLGLSACQWLPTVALLPETTRASMTLQDAAAWSLPWRYLAGLLLADHGGYHEWMTYVGVSTLVLAGVGVRAVWRRERWLVGWLVGLPVVAVWFSLGRNGGLFQVLWRVVPGLGLLRVPPRAWVLVVFAVAVLAGLGLEEARRQGGQGTRRPGRWRQTLLLVFGSFPVLLVAGYWLLIGAPPLGLIMFGVVMPLAVAITGMRHATRNTHLVGLTAVSLVALDLLVVGATLVEARSPEEAFSDGRAAAEWLAAQPGHFRVYSPSYSIPQHVAELYGLELANGVDPLQLQVYADYLTSAAGVESHGYSVTLPPFPEGADVHTALREATPDAEMLGRLGVRYVAAAFPIMDGGLQLVGRFDGVYVYWNEKVQPVAGRGAGSEIVLSDGVALFRYRPWPVYAGWAVSALTVAGLPVAWLLLGRRRG
ncbi:MAG: hypothetical protein ACE5OS_10195 [Anaerolineae bacterium]